MIVINRAANCRANRSYAMAWSAALLAPLCGCAAGSSASFTQAPLLFAEQTAPADEPASDTGIVPPSQSAPQLILANSPAVSSPTYVAIGGNAILPVAAVTALSNSVGTTLTQVASRLPAILPASLRISPATGLSLGTNAPVAALGVNANVPAGAASVGLQVGTLASVGVQASNQGLSAPALDTATLAPHPDAAVIAASVTGTVATALVLTQPVLSGATQPVAPSGSSLLTVAGGNLVRICLLKGCR